jgi:hypothetical protein
VPCRNTTDGLTMAMKAVVIIVIIIVAVTSFYAVTSIIVGAGYLPSLPPFCSGYPPGGNCHAKYSYTFTVTVNYSGPWVLNYYGFHDGEIATLSGSYYLSSGVITGHGFQIVPVELSGDNYHTLNLCAWAQKLDYSNSTLTVTVTGSNSTSAPHGSTYYCGGVAP